MNMQGHILAALREQLDRWQELLAGLSAEQIPAPLQPSTLAVKDEIAHLWAWQQRSIARLEAARLDRAPEYPQWLPGVDPEDFGATDPVNAWIYETYHQLSWPAVHQRWSVGFRHFLDLGAEIPEIALLDGGRYPWMDGCPLAVILLASYDHHQEHLDKLLARLERGTSQV